MKKTIIAAALSLVLGFSAAFANEGTPLSAEISSSFNKEFTNAQNVNWQNKEQQSIASFTWNNQILHAYYSEDGQLNLLMHNIVSDNLPVMLLGQLKNNYNGYWISDLYEAVTNGHSSYYATIENADQKMALKSESSKTWDVVKTIDKNAQQL
jgi:hypothetical protein